MTEPQQVIGEMQLPMGALASQMQALNIAHQSQAQQNGQPGAAERPAAAGKSRAGPAPDRHHGTIAAILAADRKRRRRPRASSPAPERENTRRKQ